MAIIRHPLIKLREQVSAPGGQHEAYTGIEQPFAGVGGFFTAQKDPLGIALQSRAMQNRQDYERQEAERNPFGHLGPLADPRWEGLKQALKDAGTDKIAAGADPYSQNRFTGQSVQPNYLTTAPMFMGRFNADYGKSGVPNRDAVLGTSPDRSKVLGGLRDAEPMPQGHDQFMKRYGR